MKPATFKLDRRIFELLQDGGLQRFTTRMLRDAYAQQLMIADVGQSELWRYVYDQIRRLRRVGWVRQDGTHRKRGQIYHVVNMPETLNLNLVDSSFSSAQPYLGTLPVASSDQAESFGEIISPSHRLEALAKEIRLDMLTSMGEAERYKQLFTEMPQLKAHVEDDYIEARDRSSRLLGHLRAVEKTLKVLVAV